MSSIVAIHVYHHKFHVRPKEEVEGALRTTGLKDIIHVPIKPKIEGTHYPRHIISNVKAGTVCIFPDDFKIGGTWGDYLGIKYGLQ